MKWALNRQFSERPLPREYPIRARAALKRTYHRYPAPPEPKAAASDLPDVVHAAVEACGGWDAVHKGLQRVRQNRSGVREAALRLGPHWWEKRVRISGAESVIKSPGPTILLTPHIGPTLLGELHAISVGKPVMFGRWNPLRDRTDEDSWQRMIEKWPNIEMPSIVSLPDRGYAWRALKTLRSGGTFCWQPDTLNIQSSIKRGTVDVKFLGDSARVVDLPFKLHHATGAPIALVVPRVLSRGGFSLTYTTIDVTERADESMKEVYRNVEQAVLDNIDQWSGWRYYLRELNK